MDRKKLLFVSLFTIFGIIALQIPLFQIQGSKATFTLFDFFAPLAGAFIGIIPGVISILVVQMVNILTKGGFESVATVIRLFPSLFAVWYFAKKSKISLFVPLGAMVLFNIHPIGRNTAPYSFYWLIPVVCYFLRDRFLLARSLGATFTAHAVGSTAWLYLFNLPATVWLGLIPVVAMERLSMAVGITVMYHVFVNLLYLLTEKHHLFSLPFSIEKRYVLGFLK